MRLFRSEEHVQRWCEKNGRTRGATFSVAQAWTLARLWFSDRLNRDWRRRTADEAHDIFRAAGLTGDFWRLV